MSTRLAGKVAIITGASGGIGEATARRFYEEGASLCLWDVKLRLTPPSWADDPERVIISKVDVRSVDFIERRVEGCVSHFGRLDILVNNAGISFGAVSLDKMSAEQMVLVTEVNLYGTVNCTKAVAPIMTAAGSGCIINTSSILGRYGIAYQSSYAASKAAVIALTEVWARELGPAGVRVNAVAPGYIAAGMTVGDPESLEDAVRERTGLRRMGLPEEVAAVHSFLASDDASFVSGAVLAVDGAFVP